MILHTSVYGCIGRNISKSNCKHVFYLYIFFSYQIFKFVTVITMTTCSRNKKRNLDNRNYYENELNLKQKQMKPTIQLRMRQSWLKETEPDRGRELDTTNHRKKHFQTLKQRLMQLPTTQTYMFSSLVLIDILDLTSFQIMFCSKFTNESINYIILKLGYWSLPFHDHVCLVA